MTSYRTVVFGAVMFVAAAAPALADSSAAVPSPPKTKTVQRAPERAPMAAKVALPAPAPGQSGANWLQMLMHVLNPLGAN